MCHNRSNFVKFLFFKLIRKKQQQQTERKNDVNGQAQKWQQINVSLFFGSALFISSLSVWRPIAGRASEWANESVHCKIQVIDHNLLCSKAYTHKYTAPQLITPWCLLLFSIPIPIACVHTSACIIHAHLHKLHKFIMWLCQCFTYSFCCDLTKKEEEDEQKEDDFFDDWKLGFFLPISYHQNSTRAHTHACTHKQRVRGEDSCFAFFFFFVQCTASCVIHTWPSVVANSRRNSRFTFAHSLALSFDLIIEKVLTQSVWSCVGTCSWEAFDLYVYTILHTHSTSCVYITCACACLYWFVIFVDSHFPWLPG